MFFGKGDHAFIKGEIDDLGCRVGRIAHDQHRRLWYGEAHGAFQRFKITLVGRCRHAANRGARNDETKGVNRVAGVGREHDIARRGDRLREIRKAFFRPQGHHNFAIGIKIDAKTAAIIIGLRAPKTRNPFGRGIAMRLWVTGYFGKFFNNMRRGRQIRIAHAQIDNIFTCRTCRCPHRIHFCDDIRGQAFHAVEFVGHWSLSAKGFSRYAIASLLPQPRPDRT